MTILTHGLSALMEACNQSERAETETNELMENFEEVVDDDIKACLTDDEDEDDFDDSVESDMAGNGLGDEEEKIAELVKQIPPSDDDIEEKIDALTESVIPSDELKYIY